MARKAVMVHEVAVSSDHTDQVGRAPLAGARLNVDYIKGRDFRTIHPDGVISSGSSEGRLDFAFYCERQAIPRRVVYELSADGKLGAVLDTHTRNAIVRELDVIISMSPEVALRIAKIIMDKAKLSQAAAPTSAKPPRKRKI